MCKAGSAPWQLSAREKVVLALYLTFIILSLCATVLQSGIVTAIVGFKNELALSLVMFCMLLGMFRESQLHRLTQLFYWLFYVQFPLAIYQVLVVVPKRVALRGEDEKWDSVVGHVWRRPGWRRQYRGHGDVLPADYAAEGVRI